MTEENQDSSIPKLKLSRNAEEPETGETAAEEPKQKLKLQGSEPETAKNKAEATPEPIPGQNDIRSNDLTKNEAPKPEPETAATPPAIPPQPAPVAEEPSASRLEESISQVDQDDTKGKGLLTSFLVIFVLLAILGGAGYGLYIVLQDPDEKADSDAPTSTEPRGGPIDKAKEVIANIPGNEVLDGIEPAGVSGPAVGGSSGTQDAATEAAGVDQATAANGANAAVADLLKTAHIGGVRTGDRPMLIMNGENYTPGDLIDSDSGLRFIGLREEKLAFRDGNGIVYLKSF